jgi:hypothetical protein
MRLSRFSILFLILASFLFGCSKSTSPVAPSRASLIAAELSHAGGRHDTTHVEFKGRLNAIAGTTLTVGTQTVVTDSSTRVTKGHARITVAGLAVGDSLEVEGSRQADQSVLAREIEVVVVKVRLQLVHLEGAITSVSVTDRKFAIGDSTVFVSDSTRFDDHKTLADLKVGDHVSVRALRQADGSLLAVSVEVGDVEDGGHGDGDNDHDGGGEHGRGHGEGHGHH